MKSNMWTMRIALMRVSDESEMRSLISCRYAGAEIFEHGNGCFSVLVSVDYWGHDDELFFGSLKAESFSRTIVSSPFRCL